jgi:tetratricopeptide (TPR) repeat protein
METISAILRDVQRPLNEVNAQIPVELAEIVDRCLQKEPANRYASTADLAHDLRQVHKRYTSASHSLPSFAPSNRLAGRRGSLVLATAGVLIALAALLVVLRPNQEAAPTAPGGGVQPQSTKTLLILPFLEGTGELRDEGLSLIVTAALGDVAGLQIIPPWGIPPDRDQTDVRELARYLDATYALRTQVDRAGDTVRVAFSLLDPATGKQVTGKALEGDAANPFGIAEQLAGAVAAALDVQLAKSEVPGDLLSAEAQDNFLAAAGALLRYDDPAMVDQAISLLEPLAKTNPESALVQASLGRAYQSKYALSKGKAYIALAISASALASRLNPGRAEAHVTLSKLFVLTGKPEQAVLEAQKALALRPNDSDALLALGAAFQKHGDPRSAEATYKRAIAAKPRYWATYNGLGAFYFQNKRYQEAAEMFSKVVELTPDNSRGITNLAGALMQMGRFESAVEVFRRATEARPDDPAAYTNLGYGFYHTGRLREARGAFVKAVALAPNNPKHRFNLGDCLHVLGEETEERATYEEAIRLALATLRVDPSDAEMHRQLIIAYARTGKTSRAKAHLEKSLALNPGDAEAMWYAALMSFEAGKRADGAEWLKKAAAAGVDLERAGRDPAMRPFRDYPEVSQVIVDSAQSRGKKVASAP